LTKDRVDRIGVHTSVTLTTIWFTGGHGCTHRGAPRHVHHSDDEAWYVLDGRLRVQVGTQEVEVPTGAGAFVPRGTPHTYWNPDRAPVRYLLVMTPRIYQLMQRRWAIVLDCEVIAQHAEDVGLDDLIENRLHGDLMIADRSPAALRAVFRAYESNLLEP
jgi:mannose-6-phosphate isomerase-like protein (cupin superfamily)